MGKNTQNEYKIRLERLKAIKEAGVNPYPSLAEKSHPVAKIRDSKDGKRVLTAGRLMTIRDMGKLSFGHIEDQSGRAQIALKKDIVGDEKYKFFIKKFDIGDFVQVEGDVFTTHKGEKTLLVKKYELLSKALLPLPEKFHGLKDEEERLRKRYLDMISSPEVREMFIKKAKYYQAMRDFLRHKGFVEVETPVLENSTGGADARPFVTHHNALDIDVYLRISVGELWQKKLMVAGFEKTFEMGRIFRNEGMDAEHLQDYTSMEYYWAYADWNDGMKLTEELVKYVAKETFGSLQFKIKEFDVDLNKKWEKYDYRETVKKQTGIDIEKTSIDEIKKKLQQLKVEYDEFNDLGRGIDQLWKYCRKNIAGPGYLVYPPKVVSPLAKESPERPGYVERYQLIMAGSELCNGYSELNDPIDQEERFKQQQALRDKGDEEAQMKDEGFVEALKHGMPPTTGLGISERLFAFFMDKPMRECQIFPLMKPKINHKIQLTKNSGSKIIMDLPKLEIAREKCWGLVEKYVSPESRKHLLATEAAMQALAKYFSAQGGGSGEDEHTWAMCGLLHDIDYEQIAPKDDWHKHIHEHCTEKCEQFLGEIDFPPELIRAIQSHNEIHNIPRDSKLAKALFAVDGLTGFIMAVAKIYPDKKLSSVKIKSVLKRFKEARFAAGVNREHIYSCETELNLPREKFVEIVLGAMNGIADKLGL